MDNKKYKYRLARHEDIPQMVKLFELCLGTEGGAPTVEYWNWKHNQNPSGISPVILAWDKSKLIGVRVFMCNSFKNNEKELRAYRPVDTATHPEYQGQGVFKKLTLELIEKLQNQDVFSFIFNTPNNLSSPGYLKMGWVKWGKPFLQIFPACGVFCSSFKKDQIELINYNFSNVLFLPTDEISLVKDARYFKWRYQKIPLKQYGMRSIKIDKDIYHVIYRKKKIKFINEFRICEILKDNCSLVEVPSTLYKKIIFSFGLGFISFIDKNKVPFSVSLKSKAPMITYRKIKDSDEVINFESVNWKIGELELF